MQVLNPYLQELIALREANANQAATIRKLKELVTTEITFPREWRLTRTQARILAALYHKPKGTVISNECLMVAMSQRSKHNYKSHPVTVHVCQMRKKLKPYGIAIVVDWAEGYHLPDQSYDIIAQALAQQYKQIAEREIIDEQCMRAAG